MSCLEFFKKNNYRFLMKKSTIHNYEDGAFLFGSGNYFSSIIFFYRDFYKLIRNPRL